MFESCRAHFCVLCADEELGAVRHFRAHVTERQAADCARDPADCLSAADDLRLRVRYLVAGKLEHAQSAVDLPAVVLTRDRLLARIAALREADVGLLQSGLCGKHALVELAAPARDA